MRFADFKPILGILLVAFSVWGQSNRSTLIYGDFGQPATLEPVTADRPVEHRLCQLLFDSLVVESQRGDFVFSLAREIEISPDGLSYTFLLRENLRWADGAPATAKDVEFTLDLLMNSQKNSLLATYIDEVVSINPQAITIILKRQFYSPLALFTFKILPRHKFQANYLDRSHAFASAPLGCGPFQYRPGQGRDQKYSLTRNPHFYRGKPALKKVMLKLYADKRQALDELLKKKIDLVTEVAPGDIAEVERQQNAFALCRYSARTVHFISFNYRPECRHSSLFRDPRFRRALLYAANREEILQKTFGADAKTKSGQAHALISGPFPANSWAYNDKVLPYPYDPDDARDLLQKALAAQDYFWQDGSWQHTKRGVLQFCLKCPKGDREIESACSQLTTFWKEVGIQVELVLEEEEIFYRHVYDEHDFELCYARYTPDNTMDVFPLFDPVRRGKGESNFSGYEDPDRKLESLFAQLHNTLNPWALRSVSHKIHEAIHKDAVHLFLWQLDLYAAHHRSLKNFELHPQYLFNFPEKWKIVEE